MNQLGCVTSLFLALASLAAPSLAQQPGDIYREYGWKYGPWNRVVGHDATIAGAKLLLPNPVYTIIIGDLVSSVRAEVQIEKLTSHAGTVKPKIRINGNAWLDIPEPDQNLVPGSRGEGGKNTQYLTMFYPKVSVPLGHLRQGTNKFEFTCQGSGGQGFGKDWPQFIVYAANFRIYYDANKPHPSGEITSPRSGGVLSDDPVIQASVSGNVTRVEFIGDYHDFDWRGDGTTSGWQLSYLYSKIQHHMGHASRSPWKTTWNTDWVPTQPKPFRIAARIRDNSGMFYITPAVTGISLSRNKTVIRYQNTDLQTNWVSNFWHPFKECKTYIADDLSKAHSARMFMRSWNGRQADEIGINNTRLATYIGKAHDIDWDQMAVSLSKLKQGSNQIYTKGSVVDHGIEVLWPGFEVFVKYDVPESNSEFVTFGKNCKSAVSNPMLGISGTPAIGTTYSLQITGAPANAATFLAWGVSNEFHSVTQLPFELSSFGAPGCTMLSSMDAITFGSADGSGNELLPFAVPNQASLIGSSFFNQAIIVDSTANTAGMLLTNGARTLIGK